jgi:hypothetical protein
MLWRLIFAALSFSFINTGYTVLTDPTCQRVSLSGVRLITVTCSSPGTGFSAALVGWTSLIIGLIALLVNLGIFLAELEEKVRARKPQLNRQTLDKRFVTNQMLESEQISEKIYNYV